MVKRLELFSVKRFQGGQEYVDWRGLRWMSYGISESPFETPLSSFRTDGERQLLRKTEVKGVPSFPFFLPRMRRSCCGISKTYCVSWARGGKINPGLFFCPLARLRLPPTLSPAAANPQPAAASFALSLSCSLILSLSCSLAVFITRTHLAPATVSIARSVQLRPSTLGNHLSPSLCRCRRCSSVKSSQSLVQFCERRRSDAGRVKSSHSTFNSLGQIWAFFCFLPPAVPRPPSRSHSPPRETVFHRRHRLGVWPRFSDSPQREEIYFRKYIFNSIIPFYQTPPGKQRGLEEAREGEADRENGRAGLVPCSVGAA
ncbi:hypothetical protein EJ110_NYTH02748 [Nymphaea thermarum]|nr:hypothetical protein EJ110_NYTH02748 [Nymphaea thermarum]